jgi:polyisoprenoid-binding protein YceI
MKRILSLTLVALALAWTAASAQWTLDKVHTGVQFSVKHMVVSDVTGSFKDFDVTLAGTKEDFSDAAVTAAIKTASVNTDNTGRDNHLKSDDFFNAEKYPAMSFKSTEFKKVGDNKYTITGDLTIRDVTKKVTFDATLGGVITTPMGTIAAWKATTTINRFDYNLKFDKAFGAGNLIVGKDVTINLNLEFKKS